MTVPTRLPGFVLFCAAYPFLWGFSFFFVHEAKIWMSAARGMTRFIVYVYFGSPF